MSLVDKTKRLLGKRYLLAGATALGGMIIGSIVGIGVQVGVESTGVLGPSVEALMAEQEQNFSEVYARLDQLSEMTDDPNILREIEIIRNGVQLQEQLSEQAGTELRHSSEQLVIIKEQALRDTGVGVTGVADFWLKEGQGINIGNGSQVFGLRVAGRNYADITLTGRQSRLSVGDRIGFEDEDEDMQCVVLVKQLNPRPDGSIGFDYDCN